MFGFDKKENLKTIYKDFKYTIEEIQKVLQNLLREKVPIKDIVTIFESLADNSRNTKDTDVP